MSKKNFALFCLIIVVMVVFVVACTAMVAEPVISPTVQQATLAQLVEVLKTEVALTRTPVLQATLEPTRSPTLISEPTKTKVVAPSQTYTATPDTRPDPRRWSEWPVIPTVSWVAKQIYLRGVQLGNNPRAFTTVGDCQSEPNVFMGIYETNRYWLGEDFQYLQETIDYYRGSFSRKSLAVRDGLSAPTALSVLWADSTICEPNETPIDCEMRIYKPTIVFVNLGTNWKPGASAKKYEEYLRRIVTTIIEAGAVPVLSTKADNVEGDHSINLATARVAHDYDIPLWNFWLAAQSLPNHGLDASRDNIYLTPDGWDRRNFTGLEVLDTIRRALID